MNHFSTNEKLAIHEEYCLNNEAVKIEMPDKGSLIKFKNHNRSIRVPFIVYADFEALVEPINGCEPSDEKSFTNKYQKHKPCSFCYHIKCFDDNLYSQKPVIYRGKSEDEDISQIFVDMLEKNIKVDFAKKMIMTRRLE